MTTTPTDDSTCTCEDGSADDCIPCGAPGDATTLCDTCLSYADIEELKSRGQR